MKIPASCAIALAMSASAFAQAPQPGQPTLTIGAEFKGLRFDWAPVTDVSWYQLYYRAHASGIHVPLGDRFPATATSTHFSFPLHLYDWSNASYQIVACNDSACSYSNPRGVSNLRLDAVGYFKASLSKANARFGASTALSPDGYNMVVAAPGEATTTGDTTRGGAVYVFHRYSNGTWRQRARFAIDNLAYASEGVTLNVAVSGSGNTVAVSTPNTLAEPGTAQEGAVFVYYSNGGAWTKTEIPRPHLVSNKLGTSVALSESGYVLAVGLQDTEDTVAIYKSINGVWQNVRNLPRAELGYDEQCELPRLSRDGLVIAEICTDPGSDTRPSTQYVRLHTGTNWSVRSQLNLGGVDPARVWRHTGFALDRTGTNLAVQYWRDEKHDGTGEAWVEVIQRNNAGFTDVAQFSPGQWRNAANRFLYGSALAISGDGQTITVGDPADNGTGLGPRAAPLVSGTAPTGAVYVYRFTNAKWALAKVVKPNYSPNPGASNVFGENTSLSGTGKTLVVPVASEGSSAQGIDGDWANSARSNSGAVFMY